MIDTKTRLQRDYSLDIIRCLGNKVTLGSGAVVVGGIRIGNNISIGANTVIKTDIPDNCIVYGNPCIIRKK